MMIVKQWLNDYSEYLRTHRRPSFSMTGAWLAFAFFVGIQCTCAVVAYICRDEALVVGVSALISMLVLGVFSLFEEPIIAKIQNVDTALYDRYCLEMYENFALIKGSDLPRIELIINKLRENNDKHQQRLEKKQKGREKVFHIIVPAAIITTMPHSLSTCPDLIEVLDVMLTIIVLCYCSFWLLEIINILTSFVPILCGKKRENLICDLQHIADIKFIYASDINKEMPEALECDTE